VMATKTTVTGSRLSEIWVFCKAEYFRSAGLARFRKTEVICPSCRICHGRRLVPERHARGITKTGSAVARR
jgi:hypothetical protein